MTDIFISYARSTADQAHRVAEALRALGYGVWRDDELPAHRAYAEVIEERLKAAKAVVVIWSAEAVKSEWVQSEADRARADRKLVQLSLDGAALPMPFDRIQCADLSGWTGDTNASGWRKVVASLGDLIAAVPRPAVGTPALALPSKPSIAVMPFANISGDPDQEYFADGMVVEIVTALSCINSLFVIASGSTLSFKGKGLDPQQAARSLGVRYVLEGSVRKSGSRVRISVQLIDSTDGTQIWARRFDGVLDDLFELQDEVALSVAGVIEPSILEAEVQRIANRPTESLGAYDLWLRSLGPGRSYERDGVLRATELLDRAIAMEPTFAPALASGARCRYLIDLYGWSKDLEANKDTGIDLLHRALKSAGDNAYVLSMMAGVTATLGQDSRAGLILAARAIEVNPGSAYAWMISGSIRTFLGDCDVALEHLARCLRLDPFGPDRAPTNSHMSMAAFQLRDFDHAVELATSCLQLADHPTAYACLAASHAHLGQADAAMDALNRFRALASRPIETFARSFFLAPASLKLFLDGIALAEGATATGDIPAP